MTNDMPETRRRFYVSAINALGALITAGLGIPALLYLFMPPKEQRNSQWISVADVSSLTPGMPEEVAFEHKGRDGWRVLTEKATAWLVKKPDNKVVAFAPWCTHLGCPYHWDASIHQFICPCHGSTFSLDGKVTAGPAPRPLDQYQVKVVDGKVQIGPQQTNA